MTNRPAVRADRAALPAERAFEELSGEVRNGWRDAALVDELIQFCTEDASDVG